MEVKINKCVYDVVILAKNLERHDGEIKNDRRHLNRRNQEINLDKTKKVLALVKVEVEGEKVE